MKCPTKNASRNKGLAYRLCTKDPREEFCLGAQETCSTNIFFYLKNWNNIFLILYS